MRIRRRLFEMHFNDSFSPRNNDNDMHSQATNINFDSNDDEEEEEKEEENRTKSGASSSKHPPVSRITHPILLSDESHTNSHNNVTIIPTISY